MIRVHNIKIAYGNDESVLRKETAYKLGISANDLLDLNVVKSSLDTRKKPEIYQVFTVDVKTTNDNKILKRIHSNDVQQANITEYHFEIKGTKEFSHAPVIVGAGPSGLFCALELARNGYAPILIERGKPVEERVKDVDAFWHDGTLLPDSNVQYGEGGAGTFSDGKLNTVVKDPTGRNHKVLSEFVQYGASPEILISAKPHIGTDVLVTILKRMREEILRLGGQILFDTKMTGIRTKNGKIAAISTSRMGDIPCEAVVFAIGNSARDTFTWLTQTGIQMEPKAFAVGFRMEHPQEFINTSLYGEGYSDKLPAANYKVTAKTSSGKGVYSFCMCPGGYVVNASSEEGLLAVNGMSYSRRNAANANSAIIVTVTPDDFGYGVLDGMKFQREIERRAFIAGEGKIPQQLFGDYKTGKRSSHYGNFESCVKGNAAFADLSTIYSKTVTDSFLEGIAHFDKIMPGFAREDAILSGVESRTSSPVRILRNDNMESSISGIFPCGEGAGYAGGIVSAAIDGLKTAQAIADIYRPMRA